VLAADAPAADLEHGSLAVLELAAGQLVGLEDGNDAVDAGRSMELETSDVL
jgi:hypothetical protein